MGDRRLSFVASYTEKLPHSYLSQILKKLSNALNGLLDDQALGASPRLRRPLFHE